MITIHVIEFRRIDVITHTKRNCSIRAIEKQQRQTFNAGLYMHKAIHLDEQSHARAKHRHTHCTHYSVINDPPRRKYIVEERERGEQRRKKKKKQFIMQQSLSLSWM